MEIQWTDAERVLTTLIDGLNRRYSQAQEFEHKYLRFIQWFEHFLNHELNERLDGLTLPAALDILNNEIRSMITEKRRQVNDLINQARILQSQSTDSMQIQILKQKIEQLEQMISTAEQQVDKRAKKTDITVKMLTEFEGDAEKIRSWMDSVEGNLQRLLSNPNAQQSIAVILLLFLRESLRIFFF